jgi:periplasmic copper chaperone A
MRNFLVPLVAVCLASACQQAVPGAARVEGATVRLPAVAGNPGAGYFTLHGGPVDDRLMSVSSPLAVRSEMHDMKMGDHMMMSMSVIDGGVALPAGGLVRFSSGSKHLMLFDISPKVAAGGKMPLVLAFASGAKLQTDAEVVAAGGPSPSEL